MPDESRVEHVVVLMLENRSFDHLFGYLDHPDPNFRGLRGAPAPHNNATDGRAVVATDTGHPFGLDPDHSHEGALMQIAGFGDVTANGGFVRNYEMSGQVGDAAEIMACLDPHRHAKVMSTLALEFAVCDNWFSSVPGETWPNRNFAHAATSDSTVNIETGFYYDPTIFEQIGRAGNTWHVYFDGTPELWCFRRLWRGRTLIDWFLRRKPKIGNWYEFERFLEHVADGHLASYSFIEPRHNTLHAEAGELTNSQHPHNNLHDDSDFRGGEELIRSIYEALRANPALFAKTLFVILYDEHGGLYDHITPPPAHPPRDPVFRGITRRIGRWARALADKKAHKHRDKAYDFSQYGVRIPAVLVSPWIAPGTLVPRTFDHSSIPATLRGLFAKNARWLTERDRYAERFDDTVTASPLAGPRPSPGDPNPMNLPTLPVLDEPVHRPVRARATAAAGRPAPEAVAPAASELDESLRALAEQVAEELSGAAPARRRGQPEARPGGPRAAAPRPGVTPEARSVDLFTAAARQARS